MDIIFGGGIEFGQNNDGSIFFLVRGGVGEGVGYSFDPMGESPGYDPCEMKQDFNIYVGGFAEAAIEIGSLNAGPDLHTGLHSKDMIEAYPYIEPGFPVEYGGPPVPGVKGVVAAGVEMGFVWK